MTVRRQRVSSGSPFEATIPIQASLPSGPPVRPVYNWSFVYRDGTNQEAAYGGTTGHSSYAAD